MPTSHDSGFDQTMPFVAVSTEAATAGNLVVTATTLIARLVMTTASSGNTYTGKIAGRVNGVTKSSATAFLAGAALSITTGNIALATSAGGILNAYAYGGATSTALTMDVILVPATV